MNLANRITLVRIILIPVFVTLVLNYRNTLPPHGEWMRMTAWFIFCVSILTDALDGFIARTRNQKTQLGTFLDPLADKLLLTTAIVLLTLPNARLGYRLPFWFAALAISRDVFITLGALLIHIINGSVKVVPSFLGKLTTASQMIAVCWILLEIPYQEIPVYWAALTTLFSGIGYFIFGSKQLNGTAKTP